jgi:hypothetical protein
MEGDDRKYRQNGYMDKSRDSSLNPMREDRPRPPQGPRPPLDVTGPRLPRMVQAVTAARCFNCSTTLMAGSEFPSNCPKCGAALHCCKQCSYFEPSTRFQCLKPVPVRIAAKDQANSCELFKTRVTVARDAVHASGTNAPQNGQASAPPVPRNANDARTAFDNLFRKTE